MPKNTDELVEKEGKKYKIVELPIDPPLTIRRILVPIDTTEEEIPVGGRLLDERETDGLLARASKPDKIEVGDRVRMRTKPTEPVDERMGTVSARLRTGRVTVRWEGSGLVERLEPEKLAKVW